MYQLPASVLTKSQKLEVVKTITYEGKPHDLVICIRYDDECGNNHNTFSITGSIYLAGRRSDRAFMAGGCIHGEIMQNAPEYAYLIKWHLCSSDGPMHYIANTTYHAKNGALDAARRSAIWPDATLEQLQNVELLKARLPELMLEFRDVMELRGFTY